MSSMLIRAKRRRGLWLSCCLLGVVAPLLGCGGHEQADSAAPSSAGTGPEGQSVEAPVPWTGMLGYSAQPPAGPASGAAPQTAPTPSAQARHRRVDCTHGGPGMIAAIDAASPGDTVEVTGQCSDQPLTVTKNVIIIQDERQVPTGAGASTTAQHAVGKSHQSEDELQLPGRPADTRALPSSGRAVPQ